MGVDPEDIEHESAGAEKAAGKEKEYTCDEDMIPVLEALYCHLQSRLSAAKRIVEAFLEFDNEEIADNVSADETEVCRCFVWLVVF